MYPFNFYIYKIFISVTWKWKVSNLTWSQMWETEQMHIIHAGMMKLAAPWVCSGLIYSLSNHPSSASK